MTQVVTLLIFGWQSQNAFAQGASGKQAAPPGWKQFSSKQMGFNVLMPGEPKQQSLGKKPGMTESFALPKGRALYLIIVGDYAASGVSQASLAKTPPDRFLDRMRDGYLRGSKGKLLGEKKISVQGYKGRELEVELPASGTFNKVQLIYANGRMYQLGIAAPKKEFPTQDAKRFFSSLKLVK